MRGIQKKGLFNQLREKFFGPDNKPDLEEMHDILIEADLGVKTANAVIDELKTLAKSEKIKTKEELRLALKSLLQSFIRVKELPYDPQNLNLYLFLGVNGVGKTTSIAKVAYRLIEQNRGPILLAACDTFRAAAENQLRWHGERHGLRVVSQESGSDPGAVLFDSLESAMAKKERIVLADTAGRMHNKSHLVKELQKIDKIALSKVKSGVYQKILVIDATTGQNAFQQAEVFQDAIGIDGVILSKYDSSAKGGIVLSLCRELALDFLYCGVGEKPQDLWVFSSESFVERLLGLE